MLDDDAQLVRLDGLDENGTWWWRDDWQHADREVRSHVRDRGVVSACTECGYELNGGHTRCRNRAACDKRKGGTTPSVPVTRAPVTERPPRSRPARDLPQADYQLGAQYTIILAKEGEPFKAFTWIVTEHEQRTPRALREYLIRWTRKRGQSATVTERRAS